MLDPDEFIETLERMWNQRRQGAIEALRRADIPEARSEEVLAAMEADHERIMVAMRKAAASWPGTTDTSSP